MVINEKKLYTFYNFLLYGYRKEIDKYITIFVNVEGLQIMVRGVSR